MSVINKMLRDLDSRQPVKVAPVPTPQAPMGIARDTQVVADNGPVVPRKRLLGPATMALALLVVISAMAGWWYLNQAKMRSELPQHPQGQGSSAVVEVAAVPQPSLAPPKAAPKPAESAPAPAPIAPNVAQAADAKALPGLVRQPVAKLDSAPANASLTLERGFSPGVPPKPAAPRTASEVAMPLVPDRAASVGRSDAATGVAAPALAATPPVTRISPGLEALAQAQSLWSSGKNDAAIDLLREALGHAERSSVGGLQPAKDGVLAPIVRELARMKLSEGRVSEALKMLTRLETPLSDVADVWALRGNAAQRLGRHQESVAAYLRALALRPEEARWKLGAAVSLAAQGQTTAAADLAEEARQAGAVSPEVASYLRQSGVFLRER